MATLPGPNNAIAYAQFRLQGGWKGTVIMVAVSLVGLAGLLSMGVVSALASGQPAAAVARDWPQGLVLLQVLLLLIIGTLRVTSAVRTDITNRMVESHRLMPMTPAAAVAGYAAGAPWAAIVLGSATFAFGSACALSAGADLSLYLLANLVLAVSAACVWVVATYLSTAHRFGVLVLIVVAVFAVTGIDSGGPADLVPGLEVMTAPLLSRSALVLSGRLFSVAPTAIAFAAQLAVAALCFRAAMRIYRTPGGMGMTPLLSLGLLAVWVAASYAGLTRPELFGLRLHSRSGLSSGDQLVASTVAAVLLAILPLSAAARADRVRWRSPDDPARPPAWAAWATVLAAGVLVAALPLLAIPSMHELRFRQPFSPLDTGSTNGLLPSAPFRAAGQMIVESPALVARARSQTLAVVAVTVASLAGVLLVAYRRVERAWLVVIIWLLLIWVVPLMVDAATSVDPQGRFGSIASLSPVGALAEVWTWTDANAWPGITEQVIVATLPSVLYVSAVLRGRRPVRAASPA